MNIKDLLGKTWSQLTEEQKEILLKEANPVDGSTGNNMTENGECIIDFSNGLSIAGSVFDDEIVINENSILYDPSGELLNEDGSF